MTDAERIEKLEQLVAATEASRRILARELEYERAALKDARLSARHWQNAYHHALNIAFPPSPGAAAPSIAASTAPTPTTPVVAGDGQTCAGTTGAPDAKSTAFQPSIGHVVKLIQGWES